MEWYEYMAYVFVAVGVYFIIRRNSNKGGSPRRRNRS